MRILPRQILAVLLIGPGVIRAEILTFGTPERLDKPVSSSGADFGAGISPDNQTLYFHTCKSFQSDCDIQVAQRDAEGFSSASSVNGTLNTNSNELYPSIAETPNGLELYFADGLYSPFDNNKRRQGSKGGDIWVALQGDAEQGFNEVRNLAGEINTQSLEAYPHVSADGKTLLFVSNRRGGEGQGDIYMATRKQLDVPFDNVVNLGPGVNSKYREGRATISNDGLYLFFDSNRPGGSGDFDIWMAERRTTDEPFGNAKNLGPSVNSTKLDSGPSLSPDGETLYFESFRAPNFGLGTDLWRVSISGLDVGTLLGDFNRDGSLTSEDIDALSVAVRDAGTDLSFDLTGDGVLNESDRVMWVETLVGTHFGDANLDGSVQFSDFLALSGAFGGDAGWEHGDFDGNGLIGFPDFLRLSANFGEGELANVTVPEPSSKTGCSLLILTLLAYHSRRSSRRARAI